MPHVVKQSHGVGGSTQKIVTLRLIERVFQKFSGDWLSQSIEALRVDRCLIRVGQIQGWIWMSAQCNLRKASYLLLQVRGQLPTHPKKGPSKSHGRARRISSCFLCIRWLVLHAH